MKIAFINHELILGDGTATVLWNLARRLSKDHEVTIFTFNSNYSGYYGIQVVEIPIPFKENKFVNPALLPFFQHKWLELRRLLRPYKVIYTQIPPCNLIPLFPTKIKGPLQIYTEWSTRRSTGYPVLSKIYGSFVERIDNYVVKHVDKVIAPSIHVERWLKEKFGVNSSLLYLDGIDFTILDKNLVSAQYIYDKHPALKGSPIILYVGVLSPHKNAESLIRSLKIVQKEIPNTKMIIVGRTTQFPEYYRSLVKLTQQEGLTESVIFTGAVSFENLTKYYAICDIFATCSLWEGYMRAEAFAMEKPMVAFDATSNSETIRHGETGLLVQEQTPEAFASALVTLLGDDKLRTEMGRNGYQWAKENLDFDVIAENFIKFVEDSIANKG